MTEMTKSHIKSTFFKELGQALWLERRNQRQKLCKVSARAHLPQGLIDNMERGTSTEIHNFFKLCAFYQKKIKITLIDEE